MYEVYWKWNATVIFQLNQQISHMYCFDLQNVVLDGVAIVDGANSDNIVNNGVIQSIDTVLMPPGPYLTAETLAQVLLLDKDDKFRDLLLTFMFAEMINLLERKC